MFILKYRLLITIFFVHIVSYSCKTVAFLPSDSPEAIALREATENRQKLKEIWVRYELNTECQKCLIVPQSTSQKPNRKLIYGFYFNSKEGRCKEIEILPGAGSVPPPFRTLGECQKCCERKIVID